MNDTGKNPAPRPMNQSADTPVFPEPVFGNPVSTLMQSGVGNCFPGLEFDVRQLDVRFFPGLVFDFPGIVPAGPDGTQGAVLAYMDLSNDPMLSGDEDWVCALNAAYAGDAGAALGDGVWYLHWIEQDGKRIEMYDFDMYQNAVMPIAYEGETCWWIIRLTEADKPLCIALTQRDEKGLPTGAPVTLTGQRRVFVNDEGVFDASYQPGELTASMCSPWTHDFRDCACQYWASNHPDVALGPIDTGFQIPSGTSQDDAAQALTFVDWMRRRDLPSKDVSAAPTISEARARRYDPYEINLKWEELSFVLQGTEVGGAPQGMMLESPIKPYSKAQEVIDDLVNNLAPLELTLALEYLYAYFSIRAPEEITAQERQAWPTLVDDVRAARQMLLSVALSEMTHLRWVNQILWTFSREGLFPKHESYAPVLAVGKTIPAPVAPDDGNGDDPVAGTRPRALRCATLEILAEFEFVERPGEDVDTEYAKLVSTMRQNGDIYPDGLQEIAVRIDSDGMQHYQKFRDIIRILGFYDGDKPAYLRDINRVATPEEAGPAMGSLERIRAALQTGYMAEAEDDMKGARDAIIDAREAMHELSQQADQLALEKGLGVPFFDAFPDAPDA
jgi:hypothetical protein